MMRRAIPSAKKADVDSDTLRSLIREAMSAARSELRELVPVEKVWNVFRVTEHGDGRSGGVVEAKGPDYRRIGAVEAALEKARRSPAGEAFCEYLWLHGVMKDVFSAERDGVAFHDREWWSPGVWRRIVVEPLRHLLLQAAAEDLTLKSTFEWGRVNDGQLEGALDDIVDMVARGPRTLLAICMTDSLEIVSERPVIVEPGLAIEKWTSHEKSVFLTRHEDAVDDVDLWSNGVVFFSKKVDAIPDCNQDDAPALDEVAQALDRLKWAVMVASGKWIPISEYPTILTTLSGDYRHFLRRKDTSTFPYPTRVSNVNVVNDELGEKVSISLRRLNGLRSHCRLDSIIEAFGRSCLASLSRDILVQAVIGLEMLLVPNQSGESTYKFCLHGTAILGAMDNNDNADEMFDALKKMYHLRSSAVHGRSFSDDSFHELAFKARFFLARAIDGVLDLVGTGELDWRRSNGDLAVAIANLIRRRVARRQGDTPQPG